MRAIFKYDALVDAAPGVAEHDVFAAFAARELAGGEDIHARDLEARGEHGAFIRACLAGQCVRYRAAHLPDGGDEAVALAAVFGAFANCQD